MLLKNPKVSYILQKTLVLSIICSNCGSKDEKIFKYEESIETLKMFDLINLIQEFRLTKIDKIRNYFTEEIKQNELISKKHNKIRVFTCFSFYSYWMCFNFCFSSFSWYYCRY